MQHFKVGGFVRDSLLGLEPHDTDYVVLGESPETMIERGYQQVGVGFPVFLHPHTKDEYALARLEKSTGPGYGDFVYVWEGVTLTEDLQRRDLTINAMAMTASGEIIDPFGGKEDLSNKMLRHVSIHFAEDPLRILRVARFAARYGFTVAEQTQVLMTDMVAQGMLSALKGERLWGETEKALLSDNPEVFFEVLDQCGALAVVFPELKQLQGVPQRADYHAEGDVWIHTLMVLKESVALSRDLPEESRLRIRLGALLHDLGKAFTPHELLWHEDGSIRGNHFGHEDADRFERPLNALAERLKMPSDLRQFVFRCSLSHQNVHRISQLKGAGLINLYDALDLSRALRHDTDLLRDLAMMCESDNYGRLYTLADGSLKKPESYPQSMIFIELMTHIHTLPVGQWMQDLMAKGMKPLKAKEIVMGNRRRGAMMLKNEMGPLPER